MNKMKKLILMFFMMFSITAITAKGVDMNRPNMIILKDSDARYFLRTDNPNYSILPKLSEECNLEDAIKNGNYTKAWFDANNRLIRVQYIHPTIPTKYLDFEYNDKGRWTKYTLYNENGEFVSTHTVSKGASKLSVY